MTKEHAWPQWLGKGMAVEPEQHTYISGFRRASDDAMAELPNKAVHKRGSVLTAVAREVCATCNSGWMSQLESNTRPLLERLWALRYPLGITAFSRDDIACIAAWSVKTAWVRERISDHSNVAEAARRRLFAETQAPPELTYAWVARHTGRSDFHAVTASIGVSHQDQDWASGEQRRVSLISLRFRGLAVLVRTDSGPGVPPLALDSAAWASVWPSTGSLIWPPPSPVSDANVDHSMRNISAWLHLPDTSQFKRSGDWTHIQRN